MVEFLTVCALVVFLALLIRIHTMFDSVKANLDKLLNVIIPAVQALTTELAAVKAERDALLAEVEGLRQASGDLPMVESNLQTAIDQLASLVPAA